MPGTIDMLNQKVGRLLVIERAVFTFTEDEIKEMIVRAIEEQTEADAGIRMIDSYKFAEDEKT